MKYRILFLISFAIFVSLSIANIVTSTGRIQIGTPRCDIWNSPEGDRCATVWCNGALGGEPSGSTCYDDNGNVTHLSEEDALLCEFRPGRCRVVENDRLACATDNRSASYGRDCDGRINTVVSSYVSCPISCTCPQPMGNKPCSRATWDTSTCSWNTLPCAADCRSGFTISGEKFKEGDSSDRCSFCNPSQYELDACWNSGGQYDWNSCLCGASPIVIDVLGNNFNLTNAASGVQFDINGDGTNEQIAWSSANSDDAWLALDRNGNNLIDSGKELFGNLTQQPAPPAGEVKNGFLALAVFDKPANGGNNDGKINQQDAVFSNLRLWQDANHNGISETGELKTLSQLGLAKIDLDYQDSRRTDEHGNRFRFKAKVRDSQDAQLGRWAWDVYLVVEP